MDAHLYGYLWDLEDEGLDHALDVIRGTLGAKGITVPVVHAGVEQLRVHENVSPRWFRSAGGLQFQPEASRYRGTRIRPVVAEWLKKRNPLAKLAEACATRSLELCARVSAGDVAALAAANGDHATVDAFDEPNPEALCPLDADVQEFVRSVVRELAETYGAAAIELDGWAFAPRAIGETACSAGERDILAALLSVCFCQSCRREAGRASVDVAAAQRSIRVDLERMLAGHGPTAANVEEYLASRGPVRELYAWREARAVQGLFDTWNAASQKALLRAVAPADAGASLLQSVGSRCDGLCGRLATADEASVPGAVGAIEAAAPGLERAWFVVDARTPPIADSAALVRLLGVLAERGVAGVHLFNYGLIAPARLGWIKQAIRYAHREA